MKIYAGNIHATNLDRFVGKDIWIGVPEYVTEPTWLSWYKIEAKVMHQGRLCYKHYILFDDEYMRMKRRNSNLAERETLLQHTLNTPFYDPVNYSMFSSLADATEYMTTDELFKLGEWSEAE